jgi:hypothetical protein
MFTATTQPENDAQQPSYIVAATTTSAASTTNGGLETPALSNIKILCTQSRKVCEGL